MPSTPTSPGITILEIPSGVRTITGVATSVAAFVGYFSRGLLNTPVQIFNFGDFEREFGGLHRHSEASYEIQQFFLNGGTEAWVVRTASGNIAAAGVEISSESGALALSVEAGQNGQLNPGEWANNNLRVNIDYPAITTGERFNMTVTLVEVNNGQETVVLSEVFNRLSIDPLDTTNFVEAVINDDFSGSQLIRVSAGSEIPQRTGTVSEAFDPTSPVTITDAGPQINVTIGDESGVARLLDLSSQLTLQDVRSSLESAIRTARPELRSFSQATVSIEDNRLRISAGPTNPSDVVVFSVVDDPDPTASGLGLLTGESFTGLLSADISNAFPISTGELSITISSGEPEEQDTISLTLEEDELPDLEFARNQLENAIQSAATENDAIENARVVAYRGENGAEERLIVLVEFADLENPELSFGNEQLAIDLGLVSPGSIEAFVSNEIDPVPTIRSGDSITIEFGDAGGEVEVPFGSSVSELGIIALELEDAIRKADPNPDPNADPDISFTGARVAVYDSNPPRLVLLSGDDGESIAISAPAIDTTTANELNLAGASANVQTYVLGVAEAIANTAQGPGTLGNDGDLPDGNALIGNEAARTGFHALRDVDLFNILCIPRTAIISGENALSETEARAVLAQATEFCEERRAFLLIDKPTGVNEVQEIRTWLEANNNLRSRNSALYFPCLCIPDPLNDFKLREVGASGTIAGLYARIDSNRGVWKAPAGTEATLSNVFKLTKTLTDAENGTLNPLAINCLRTFPIYGTICWGARTLDGADENGSEYKYIPVRRLALFIEETLFRALKWVVFEPNDEPLWAQIRLNVGAFMNNLFRQGAFQGQSSRQAYLVKCDGETTTQNDIDRGIVNILVGFAPLKPAEFVIIKIQQLAGEIQT